MLWLGWFISVASATRLGSKLMLVVSSTFAKHRQGPVTLQCAIDQADALMSTLPASVKGTALLRIADGEAIGSVYLPYLLALCYHRDVHGGLDEKIDSALQELMTALGKMAEGFKIAKDTCQAVANVDFVEPKLSSIRSTLMNRRRLLRANKTVEIVQRCIDAWDEMAQIPVVFEQLKPLDKQEFVTRPVSDLLREALHLTCAMLSVLRKVVAKQFESELRHVLMYDPLLESPEYLASAEAVRAVAFSLSITVAFSKRIDCIIATLPEHLEFCKKLIEAIHGTESDQAKQFRNAQGRLGVSSKLRSVGLVDSTGDHAAFRPCREADWLKIRQFLIRWLQLAESAKGFESLEAMLL